MTNILETLDELNDTGDTALITGASNKLLELTGNGVKFDTAIKTVAEMLNDPNKTNALRANVTSKVVIA